MSTPITVQKPYVVHGPQDPGATAQTRGMVRSPGIVPGTAGASKIWLGLVTAAPHEQGPPHHHGEAPEEITKLGRSKSPLGHLLKGE